ncbi:hypothetical protein LGL55_14300 [Clostridium tagluense]|uniref:hypothetical protein n=1 Tax=Clostridium TaxID=1485 RepID=UPI0013E904E9|nr:MULTISPECIES: hypothetical protein [Clostridium]MBU3127512.1 hypothetical protein [Clostridium tagluense]MBW9156790.1 hypothetical protein [Clostridium tagluense]MBZ9621960.1 hypothetical protein [Clostridium sp. FP2]MCB2312464.1 hypothetical protein [Clostridium tagluense]MCB2317139.1 hypothetical protein [Clostridium tagluense]
MGQAEDVVYILEQSGININNEKSLHSSIKQWYAIPGDRLEVKVDKYIIDLVREDSLIEIQTRNFSAIGNKLRELVKYNMVTLVHPIAIEKYIVTMDDSDKVISRRKSPKKGKLVDLFDELIRIPDLIDEEKFILEILMTKEEEIRCKDGKGSWRRKGISIVDRKLVQVVEKVTFKEGKDFLMFLPEELPGNFTNKDLAKILKVTVYKARKVTYCLRKMKIIKEVGKLRNELIFERR